MPRLAANIYRVNRETTAASKGNITPHESGLHLASAEGHGSARGREVGTEGDRLPTLKRPGGGGEGGRSHTDASKGVTGTGEPAPHLSLSVEVLERQVQRWVRVMPANIRSQDYRNAILAGTSTKLTHT